MRPLVLAAALALAGTTAGAEPAAYAIDPTHTFVTFESPHFNTSTNRGRFDKKSGTVQLDKAGKSGKLELTIDMTSINTGVEPFNKHLRSPDFFDAENFPTATFVGERFVFDGDKVSEVSGQLTLRARTHPVTLKALHFNCYQNPMLEREACGGDFETTIQRSQWGIDFGIKMGFADATRLIIQVEAIKQ